MEVDLSGFICEGFNGEVFQGGKFEIICGVTITSCREEELSHEAWNIQDMVFNMCSLSVSCIYFFRATASFSREKGYLLITFTSPLLKEYFRW